MVDATKELIRKAIAEKLDISSICSGPSSKKLVIIADLGCSTGPNTFYSIQNIIESIELEHPSVQQDLEFQVFFNDHVSNDFNTLFRNISPSTRYYAAGVPGSFHGRLFPESTLHIGHSSHSLHWLSKVPPDITDKNSPAWNKGRIFWSNSANVSVVEAYISQHEKDMSSFLKSRAEEILVGGLLLLSLTVRPDNTLRCLMSSTYEAMGSCLIDMANEGKFPVEKVDSFNLPIHFPTIKELEAVVEENGCFSIEKMELLNDATGAVLKTMSPDSAAVLLRSVFGAVIVEHFGHDTGEELFPRISEKIKARRNSDKDIDRKNANLFVVLKRRDRA